jgi:hypothetical protein
MAGCVYSRLASLASRTASNPAEFNRELQTGLLYLKLARRRNSQRFAELRDNDDHAVNEVASLWLNPGDSTAAASHGAH